MNKVLLFTLLVVCCYACKNNSSENASLEVSNGIPAPPLINYNIVNIYPHDTSYYTEGLQLYNGHLYESTGNYGASKLVKVDPKTGKAVKEIALEPLYFGEGMTVLNDTIYQMTYREGTGFVYDMNFKLIRKFNYEGEGWGMTTDGKYLLMSDGSSNIYFRDPATFRTQNIISVSDNNGPVANINELEYVNGVIYANVWNTNTILKVDPSNGHVTGKMDFTGVLERLGHKGANVEVGNVLNGIAYDSTSKNLLVTGKLWPLVFEVKL